MNILLVEDDNAVATVMVKSLSEAGYSVSLAPDGDIAYAMISESSFDLIIMDIMLPGMNGLTLCKKIRGLNINTPVLMLTALGTTQNVVAGLDSGADDYLVKPYKLEELLARVRSMIRRSQRDTEVSDTGQSALALSDLSLDSSEKVAVRGKKKISLTATEYRLLEYLLQNKRRVLSRADILDSVWGIGFNMNTKVVDVYINYLRKKIDDGFDTKLIHTVVGMGYILKTE